MTARRAWELSPQEKLASAEKRLTQLARRYGAGSPQVLEAMARWERLVAQEEDEVVDDLMGAVRAVLPA